MTVFGLYVSKTRVNRLVLFYGTLLQDVVECVWTAWSAAHSATTGSRSESEYMQSLKDCAVSAWLLLHTSTTAAMFTIYTCIYMYM